MGLFLSIVAFIIVFSVLILVHELGHFTAAKWSKVKVEEFGMGLPPKAKTLFKKGDTEYTLNWIPFGGFVRMLGESDISGKLAKDKTSFSSKSVWTRMFIAAAGVLMNFLLAIALLTIIFIAGFKPFIIVPDALYPLEANSYLIPSESFAKEQGITIENPKATLPITITEVEKGTPADELGLTADTAILKINDKDITSAQDYRIKYQSIQNGEDVTLTVQTPEGEIDEKTFTKESKILGIYLQPSYILSGKAFTAPWYSAPLYAVQEVGTQIVFTVSAVGGLLSDLVTQFTLPEEIGGPIQIASAVHQATQVGITPLIILTIILSINLGVFNILPFPALDGGRIIFMLYEIIFRKKPNQQVEVTIHYIGYVLLLALLVAVTYQDIMRLFFVR